MPLHDTSPNFCNDCFAREMDGYHQQARAERGLVLGAYPIPGRIAVVSMGHPAATVQTVRVRLDQFEINGADPRQRPIRMTPRPDLRSPYMSLASAMALEPRRARAEPSDRIVTWVIGAPVIALALGAGDYAPTPEDSSVFIGIESLDGIAQLQHFPWLLHRLALNSGHHVALFHRSFAPSQAEVNLATAAASKLTRIFGWYVPATARRVEVVTKASLLQVASELALPPHGWPEVL